MTINKPETHALLSASGSSRWIGCPASVAMEFGIKDDPSEYAEEGTRAHKLASDELDYFAQCKTRFIHQDEESPLAQCADTEMKTAVKLYIDYLKEIRSDESWLSHEQKVDFSNAVIGGRGTADAIMFNPMTEHLDVVDLKYGFTKVEAKDNTQLLLYAIGAVDMILNSSFERINSNYKTTIKIITLHIAQPRINNFDTWTVSIEELQEWIKYFQIQSIKALTLKDQFNPSIDTCKYCNAKEYCPALKSFVDNMTTELKQKMDNQELFVVNDNKKITNDFIKEVLDNSALIKKYLEFVENTAMERLICGEEIPGYKLVRTEGRRKINKDAEVELHDCYGDKIYKKQLLSLGELEKVVGKRNLDTYAHKGNGSLAVVKDTDKRLSTTKITFDNLNQL